MSTIIKDFSSLGGQDMRFFIFESLTPCASPDPRYHTPREGPAFVYLCLFCVSGDYFACFEGHLTEP